MDVSQRGVSRFESLAHPAGRLPEALVGTQAGRLLAKLLADPVSREATARAALPRGMSVGADGAVITAGSAAIDVGIAALAPAVAPGWSAPEVAAAQAAAGRRERRLGALLVAGATLVVAVAIAAALMLRAPTPDDAGQDPSAAPALVQPREAAAAAPVPADDEPLIIEEPLLVNHADYDEDPAPASP